MNEHPSQAPVTGSFASLVQGFANLIGIPYEESDPGIAFEVSGNVVTIVPDTTDTSGLVLEIAPGLSPGENPALLRLLLQLNDEAGHSHRWVLALDADAQLLIRVLRTWSLARPEDLIDWLADGIERAEAVRALVENFPAPVRLDPIPVSRDAKMIRG
jgi:hypothetical protein